MLKKLITTAISTIILASIFGKDAGTTIKGMVGAETPAAFVVSMASGQTGDVNLDGQVDSADASLSFQYTAGKVVLTEKQLAQADILGTGTVDAAASRTLFRYTCGATEEDETTVPSEETTTTAYVEPTITTAVAVVPGKVEIVFGEIVNVSYDGYDAVVHFSDDSDMTAIRKVEFPTWTKEYKPTAHSVVFPNYNASKSISADDLKWHAGTVDQSTKTATYHVTRDQHNKEYGLYTTHVYAYGANDAVMDSIALLDQVVGPRIRFAHSYVMCDDFDNECEWTDARMHYTNLDENGYDIEIAFSKDSDLDAIARMELHALAWKSVDTKDRGMIGGGDGTSSGGFGDMDGTFTKTFCNYDEAAKGKDAVYTMELNKETRIARAHVNRADCQDQSGAYFNYFAAYDAEGTPLTITSAERGAANTDKSLWADGRDSFSGYYELETIYVPQRANEGFNDNDDYWDAVAPTEQELDFMRNEFVRLVNIERVKNGLSELQSERGLTTIGNVRAQELSIVFSHQRPNGDPYTETGNYIGKTGVLGYPSCVIPSGGFAVSPTDTSTCIYFYGAGIMGECGTSINARCTTINSNCSGGSYSIDDLTTWRASEEKMKTLALSPYRGFINSPGHYKALMYESCDYVGIGIYADPVCDTYGEYYKLYVAVELGSIKAYNSEEFTTMTPADLPSCFRQDLPWDSTMQDDPFWRARWLGEPMPYVEP